MNGDGEPVFPAARCRELSGWQPGLAQCRIARRLFELAERRHVLGRASDDEPGAVAVTAERQRQRPELRSRKPFDEIWRQLGEAWADRNLERAGGAGARLERLDRSTYL